MTSETFDTPARRLILALAVAFGLLFIAAAVHNEQVDVFGEPPYPVYLLRQVFFESIAQPFYLFVAVFPVAAGAWVGVGWVRLVSGGPPLVSTVLPYGAFTYIRVSNGELVGYHTSLHQLASPQHGMEWMLPGLLLITAGGLVSLAWRAGPGTAIATVGLIATAIGWTVTERAGQFVIDDRALMSFPTSALLFGYYIGWIGVSVGAASALQRWFSNSAATTAD